MEPRYSIGTWDRDAQAYTPQARGGPWANLTAGQLRRALRRLRHMGYSAHRRRDKDGTHDDNDTEVLVERTDGKPQAAILAAWQR